MTSILNPEILANLKRYANPAGLTSKEIEVLILVTEGLTNKEAAVSLGVGERTIETHRERIIKKIRKHENERRPAEAPQIDGITAAHFVKYAGRNGIITVAMPEPAPPRAAIPTIRISPGRALALAQCI